MKHVKYFSKRPADNSVKQFSSKSGYVRRFSAKAKGEISLSGMDPDKYYLYRDSNVTIPGFAIDKGSYITSGSRFSRGYQLTKAYGPFDSASEAEAYANESGISLIDTTVPETQPEVTEMSGDDGKLNELEAKVDTLTDLVTKLTEKLSEVTTKEEEVSEPEPETEAQPEEPVVEETEEVTETEEPEESVVEESAEESSEEVCPECGQNPCVCEETEEEVADNGVTEDDVGLGEKVPANTGKVDTVYTQVPEDDILAQFSNSSKPEPEEIVSMSTMTTDSDSMFNVLFR